MAPPCPPTPYGPRLSFPLPLSIVHVAPDTSHLALVALYVARPRGRCPGGQIVPTATESGRLCVNGMSYSNRGSMWANSAVVVTVGAGFGDFGELSAEDADGAGVLAGLEFQEEMEARAAAMGGGELVCPVQVAQSAVVVVVIVVAAFVVVGVGDGWW